jgi:hypothetical protein
LNMTAATELRKMFTIPRPNCRPERSEGAEPWRESGALREK